MPSEIGPRRIGAILQNPALGCSSLVVAVTGAYLACGLGAFAGWTLTGNDVWIVDYFQVPAALAMVWLAVLGLWLSVRALQQFQSGEVLHRAWFYISLSALCDATGAISVQILGAKSALNPFVRLAGSGALFDDCLTAGHIVGGTLRFALLALGLWYAVQAYRRSGFLARLKPLDWLLLAAFALYLARVVYDLRVAFAAGKPFSWTEAAGWPVDPLLWLLLLEATRLYRSVERMGGGWIGRCWKAFSIGILLTALGDIGYWAYNYGFLPYPWNSITWYLWLPAAAAYALAPAYQLEAIHHAGTPPDSSY